MGDGVLRQCGVVEKAQVRPGDGALLQGAIGRRLIQTITDDAKRVLKSGAFDLDAPAVHRNRNFCGLQTDCPAQGQAG